MTTPADTATPHRASLRISTTSADASYRKHAALHTNRQHEDTDATLCYRYGIMSATTDLVRTLLAPNITTGKYSTVFVGNVAACLNDGTTNVATIFHAIGSLEGAHKNRPERTRPPTLFRRPPLKGLWHKHFHEGTIASMALNIQNHWNGRLDQLISKHFHTGEVVTQEAISGLVHDLVIKGYADRGQAGKITGEWIVFAKQDGINYYLTLGVHGDDDAIAKRVRMCIAEFPQVRTLKHI